MVYTGHLPGQVCQVLQFLPGDEIVGFITRGFGVSIHKKRTARTRRPAWRTPRTGSGGSTLTGKSRCKENYKATLEMVAMDRDGLVGDVAVAWASCGCPFMRLTARSADNGRASMSATLGISSTEHLNSVVAKLRRVKDMITVTRI